MKHKNDIHIPTVEEIDDYMSKYDSESRYRRYSDWKKYLIIAISVVFCLFQLYSILSGKITAQIVRATHVHHIQELRDRPDLAFDADNLISLCHTCHEEVHDRLAKANGMNKRNVKFMNEDRW